MMWEKEKVVQIFRFIRQNPIQLCTFTRFLAFFQHVQKNRGLLVTLLNNLKVMQDERKMWKEKNCFILGKICTQGKLTQPQEIFNHKQSVSFT